MSKILVVLSGGQDSVTCLYEAIRRVGVENVHAITFDYGQRHNAEISAAAEVAEMSGLSVAGFPSERHEIISVEGLLVSASPLTSDTPLDKYDNFNAMEEEVGNKVEKTFVPMRNSLFFIIAANRAVALGCTTIMTGICGEDNANYPDCTDNFRKKLELAINVSLDPQQPYITIEAPLMRLSKAETVKLAMTLPGCMRALSYSHTSYDGKFPPVDNNHSNLLRAHGFEEAGVPDPLVLRAWKEGLMALPTTPNYNEDIVVRAMKDWGL